MIRKLVCGGLGALMLASATAQASEATTVADRAGFLLGHAHRCGVAADRLQHSATLMTEVIAAFSSDAEDRKAAQAVFDERILAGALAELLGDPVPSCAIVRSELTQFERHRQATASQPGNRREGQMARDTRADSAPAQRTSGPGAKPAKSAGADSKQPKELTAARRAALELRRIAQQNRGRPPSI